MSNIRNLLWNSRYISVLCSTFLGYVGFQMLVPTLTAYIKQSGGTDLSAGLVYSVAAGAALVARAVCGNKLDTIGRKPLLIAGSIALIFVNILLFQVSNVGAICLLRLIQGLGWGVVSTALATIVSDVVPIDRRGEGIGYFSLIIALATSLSIILGIWLMNQSGFMATLLFSSVIFALSLALCALTPPVPFCRNEKPRRGEQHPLDHLFEKRALFPAFLCFLHSVGFSGIMAFIMLFGAESGIRDVWIYFIGHLAVIIVTRPAVGKIFDRKGAAVLVIPGALLTIIGLVILSYARTIPFLVVASLCYGSGFGAIQPSLQAWAVNRSPPERKGAANGTFLSSFDLGYALGTVLMGAIASATSYAVMYRVAALLPIALLIIFCVFLLNEGKTD